MRINPFEYGLILYMASCADAYSLLTQREIFSEPICFLLSRINHQTNLVSLISVSGNITFSPCPTVGKNWSKIIHLREPRSLKQKCAGLSELQDQAVSQQHFKKKKKKRSEGNTQIQEGSSIRGCADLEQGRHCPENRRAILLKVMLLYLSC